MTKILLLLGAFQWILASILTFQPFLPSHWKAILSFFWGNLLIHLLHTPSDPYIRHSTQYAHDCTFPDLDIGQRFHFHKSISIDAIHNRNWMFHCGWSIPFFLVQSGIHILWYIGIEVHLYPDQWDIHVQLRSEPKNQNSP